MSRPAPVDPHFLHRKATLARALRVPCEAPCAVSWLRDGALLVGTDGGHVLRVHPVDGTSTLVERGHAILGVAPVGDDIVVVDAGGWLLAVRPDGVVRWRGRHPYLGAVTISPYTAQGRDQVLIVGPTLEERRALFYERGSKAFRIRLPDGALPVPQGGGLGLAQPTAEGLEIIAMRPGLRFQGQTLPGVALRQDGQLVTAFDARRAWVWTVPSEPVRARPPIAEVAVDGASALAAGSEERALAVGLADGGLRIVALPGTAMSRAEDAGPGPVRAVAFDPTGAWLASASDRLTLWSVNLGP